MARGTARLLEVSTIDDVSPNMRRITLGGTELAGFPADQEGAYIKLMLASEGLDTPAVRTYTVRHHREQSCEIDVDFVIHGDHGVASAWASRVTVGDRVRVGGPGPKKAVSADADWYFFVGDMTALPAISVNLSALPDTAVGYAVIEVLDENDCVDLAAPAGIDIQWVEAHDNDAGRKAVLKRVRDKPWLSGEPAIWAASEFDTMKALRQYFKKERGLHSRQAYISSYWKNGLAEDAHKIAKKKDADAEIAST